MHCRPTAESGLRAGQPCVPGGEGHGCTYVCGRGQCSRVCRACGRSVRKDGRTALVPAAVATKRRRPCLGCAKEAGRRDTDGHCSDGGCAAQKHRSASLTEEKPASREAPQQAHRGILEGPPWSRCCVPMRSYNSRWRAARPPPSAVLRYMLSRRTRRGVPGSTRDTGSQHCPRPARHSALETFTIRVTPFHDR